VALVGLFLIAAVAAVYHGRSLLAPIVVAVLLKFLLAPPVRWLERLKIPNVAGALLVMAAGLSLVGGAVYGLAGPIGTWVDRAPRSLVELERALERWRPSFDELSDTAEKVTEVTRAADDKVVDVRVSDRPPLQRALATTWPAVANTLIVLILLYFLLAGGDLMIAKLVESLPRMADKKTTVRTLRELERTVSRYLMTITGINIALGVVVGLVCYFAGLPDALLWGAMAALFNFVPFVGALVGVAVIGLASVVTLGVTPAALFAPVAYLALSGFEGYVITPTLLGRNLSLSPVAVFISMLFWGWAWGLIGVLIAVPMLMIVKIALGISDRYAVYGRFLAAE
jgi:predicted PurR-regulated permease PerM